MRRVISSFVIVEMQLSAAALMLRCQGEGSDVAEVSEDQLIDAVGEVSFEAAGALFA